MSICLLDKVPVFRPVSTGMMKGNDISSNPKHTDSNYVAQLPQKPLQQSNPCLQSWTMFFKIKNYLATA